MDIQGKRKQRSLQTIVETESAKGVGQHQDEKIANNRIQWRVIMVEALCLAQSKEE